ncbi:PLC-like phosphodiesterase [Clohesyomyces aquaticus]|uniref:PLC-like phosphodiesterase n=1 Tax=Clohesyomyces aquaticus TaxID=1231657 RepID=A0A1Y1ZRS8_9PLEO|nr:PLC-like phosphodiesterase [Clohesyomyces aquaticus]
MFLQTLLQAAALLPILYSTASAQTACNNSPSLCNKPYNNITHLGAHDSPFLRNEQTSFSTSGNQYYNSTVQLDAGVRLLTAQVHKANETSAGSQWHLCHTSCSLLDMGTLESWLSSIKSWMDKNPNDVVTILLVNSDNAAASDLGSQFKSSGIDKYAYVPPSTTTIPQNWPTLQSLISNGTRLMTFVASITPSTTYPYLMDEFTFMFENDFNNEKPTDFSCVPARPTTLNNSTDQALSSGRMFLMNHFLYDAQLFGIQTPNENAAGSTNGQTGVGSLGTSLSTCTSVYNGRVPTFTIVDFFNRGPAMASVDKANGVTNPVGRISVPEEALKPKTGGGKKNSGSLLAVVLAVVAAVAFGC